jgi:hypothetical protein
MKYIIIGLFYVTALSCHKSNEKSVTDSTRNINLPRVNEKQKEPVSDTAAVVHNAGIPPPIAALNSGSPDWDKKIIKTATLNLELKEYAGFNATVHQSLKNYSAYIAQEQQLQSEGEISNQVIIKVPVDQFESLVNYLTTIDKKAKLLDRQIVSEDVSVEVVDTWARLETKKQLRVKYYELLKQAKKMEDVLQVQNEINAITEDIEAAAGRVAYLSHQSAYSTVNLKYYQVLDAAKANDDSSSFFTSFINAFKQGGSIIANLFLFIVNIWPLVIGGISAWFIFKNRILKPKPQ